MQRVVGLDLGLRSGAVVDVLLDGAPRIVSMTTIYHAERQRRRRGVPAPKLDPAGLAMIGQEICRDIPQGVPVGIDWDLTDGLWGNQRRIAASKAFLAGYVYRCILASGGRPLCVPPRAIRDWLGLKATAEKELVQEKFYEMLSIEVLPSAWSQHEIDAAILAVFTHQHLTGGSTSWQPNSSSLVPSSC